ncbi:MAG TPA: hypothetical protein DC049_12010 [Spirochaetia bacterium]|nr:hypothetical protein [Spirochaetia bacterium]
MVILAGVNLFAAAIKLEFQKDTYPVPPYFFGEANPKTFEIHNDRMEYTNDTLLQYKKEMRITSERGPCGTGANFFIWDQGICMTSKNPDYEKYFGEHKIGMVEGTQTDVKIPLNRDLLLYDADALGIPYVYCLNIFSDNDRRILESVADLKKHMGQRPVFVELGNEVYAIGFKTRFPKLNDYIDFIKRISPQIRNIDKNIKISVVGFSPVMYAEMGVDSANKRPEALASDDWEYTQAGRIEHWNEELAKISAFYDAVTIHYYNRVRKFDNLKTPDDAMRHFFAGNEFYYKKMTELGTVFTNSEFWCTEWNIFNVAMQQAKDDDSKSVYNINKQSGAAVIIASLELRMLATKRCTISSLHSFYSANGFGLVNFLDRSHRDIKVKLPQYYTLQAVGIILEKYKTMYFLSPLNSNDFYRSTELDPMKTEVKYPRVETYGFGDSLPRVLVLFNTGNSAEEVSLDGHKLHRIWAYGDPDPFPDYLEPKKYHWTSAPDYIPAARKPDNAFAPAIAVEPYSMTICEIDQASGLQLVYTAYKQTRAATPKADVSYKYTFAGSSALDGWNQTPSVKTEIENDCVALEGSNWDSKIYRRITLLPGKQKITIQAKDLIAVELLKSWKEKPVFSGYIDSRGAWADKEWPAETEGGEFLLVVRINAKTGNGAIRALSLESQK